MYDEDSLSVVGVTQEELGEGATEGDVEVASEPSVNQKLFLVASVALATVCFFTNAVQVAVFSRPSSIRSVKSILLLSQALSGVVASFVVAFPIHVISTRGANVQSESGFAACYLGHSAVIVLALLTSLGTCTLLLLDHYLRTNHPRRYSSTGNSASIWAVAVALLWTWCLAVALLPYAGWNSWVDHDARCHLSTLWPLSFTAFLTFVVGAHVAVALSMWASMRATQLKATNNRHRATQTCRNQQPEEAVPMATQIAGGVSVIRGGGVRLAGWCISLVALMPVLAHVMVASSCAASSVCQNNPMHYHEDEAGLPWASLLLAAAAVINPLLYIFTDDQVSQWTLLLLSRLCCGCCQRRKQRLLPRHQAPADDDGNTYVANDRALLVGDNM